jgi:Family of unknown function (DUF6113)
VATPAVRGARGGAVGRVGAGVALAVVSGLVAICAALVSRGAWRSSTVTLPWGLVLGVAGSVSLVVVTRLAAGRRPGLVAAGGWLLGIALVLLWHPGGDYLFANDGLGYGFLLGATLSVLLTAGWGDGP